MKYILTSLILALVILGGCATPQMSVNPTALEFSDGSEMPLLLEDRWVGEWQASPHIVVLFDEDGSAYMLDTRTGISATGTWNTWMGGGIQFRAPGVFVVALPIWGDEGTVTVNSLRFPGGIQGQATWTRLGFISGQDL